MNIIVKREKIMAISNAVKQKAGMSESDSLTLDEMPGKIGEVTIAASNLPDRPKDVNFYDYNGQLLYAYSFEEASQLTKFPVPPLHKNLLFQGWNEPDLDFIKKVRLPHEIGAVYTTVDNKTHCFIHLGDDGLTVKYGGGAYGGTMFINWGDGTDDESYACESSYSGLSLTHKFESAGDYDVSIWAEDSEELLVDAGCFSESAESGKLSPCLVEVNYSSQVKRLGTSTYGGVSALEYGPMLKRVSIPLSVEIIHGLMQNGTGQLWYPLMIVIPAGVKEISAIGYSYAGCRLIYPRGIKKFVGTGNFYVETEGNDRIIADFPDMVFVDSDGNEAASFPTVSTHSNIDCQKVSDAYFIFKNAGGQLFSSIKDLDDMRHIHVADELYQAAFLAWKTVKEGSSRGTTEDCKRISMENGTEYTADKAAGTGVTTVSDDDGMKIVLLAEKTTLTGTAETVDSGVVSAVSVTPSEYSGVIKEVAF